jgi:hypothetical protein
MWIILNLKNVQNKKCVQIWIFWIEILFKFELKSIQFFKKQWISKSLDLKNVHI